MNILCLCKKCFIKNKNNLLLDNYIDDHEIKIINELHGNECFICLEPLNNRKKCIILSCCNSKIHVNCFKEWCTKNNAIICPLCITTL